MHPLQSLPSSQDSAFSQDSDYPDGNLNLGEFFNPATNMNPDVLSLAMMMNMGNGMHQNGNFCAPPQHSTPNGRGGRQLHANIRGTPQMAAEQSGNSAGLSFNNHLFNMFAMGQANPDAVGISQFGDITNLERPSINFAPSKSDISISATEFAQLRAELEGYAAKAAAAQEAAQKAREAAEAAEAQIRLDRETEGEKAVTEKSSQRSKALALLHETSKSLMGMGLTINVDAEVMPDPVGPDEEEPTAEDGAKFWRPCWNKPPSYSKNRKFIMESVRKSQELDKVLSAAPVLASFTDNELQRMMTGYFRTLRLKWKRQTSSSVDEKQQTHETGNRRRNRRKKAAKRMREAIPDVREHFGQDETEGLEAMVQSEYNTVGPKVEEKAASKSGGGHGNQMG
ncbi:hypothetical protein B0H11DRAFT_2248176 [Mycena galericulata]|nr:hypothetical protein B0H11DRAFT_2248176 [Mycena galericulata]